MNIIYFRTSFIFLFITIFLFCGCARKVTKEEAEDITPYSEITAEEKEGISPEGPISERAITEESFKDYSIDRMKEFFRVHDIKFSFDDFTLTPRAMNYLDKVAEWMMKNPRVIIKIEGHCCEMGTNEYNLALGERRANSAKKYLLGLGIGTNRILTISYGEERPLYLGHTEETLAKNRRDQFLIEAR
jgi:peptidoglycan-associated lipoprotein